MKIIRSMLLVICLLPLVVSVPLETGGASDCESLPPDTLIRILGQAFNSRYMSIEEPIVTEVDASSTIDGHSKRGTGDHNLPFFVPKDYAQQISDRPAWELMTHAGVSSRSKRSTPLTREPRRARNGAGEMSEKHKMWTCETRINWIDLGEQYFPRFLRTVECTMNTCWYGMFQCKPKSFTVNLLRRRPGKCSQSGALVEGNHVNAQSDMPKELRELWVWEERAVNFCCECGIPD